MDELEVETQKMINQGWIRSGVWKSKEAPVFVQNLVKYFHGTHEVFGDNVAFGKKTTL